ncbi:MAG: hypothetical protein QGH41_10425, partial [Roseibacillus sp.]|nr:hypothetical protein [Roseibacillus sp.]
DNDLVRIYAGASPERRQELRAELAKDRVEDPTQLAKDFSSGAGLLGEAIQRIHNGKSVSSLFDIEGGSV